MVPEYQCVWKHLRTNSPTANNQLPARNHGQSTTLDSSIIDITHLCHSRSINRTSSTTSQSPSLNTMAAPGASFPAHLQTNRRTEAHQQRLLQVQAELLAAKHPILSNGPGAKPAGLYNEGNTCFFNSTFQALAATTSLIDLVGPVIFPYTSSTANAAVASSAAPSVEASSATANDSNHTTPHLPPEVQALDHPAKSYTSLATGSDGYPLYPHSIPSLLDAALEPEHAKLLPVTLAFEKCLGKAWKAKDEGLKEAEKVAAIKAGEDGSSASAGGSAEKEKSVSLKALLRELGKKYDQYEDVSLLFVTYLITSYLLHVLLLGLVRPVLLTT
jgi:hypothetical protein